MTMFIMFPGRLRACGIRAERMSFGPLRSAPISRRGAEAPWAALYLVPIAVLIVVSVLIAVAFGSVIEASDGLSPTVNGVILAWSSVISPSR